MTLGTADGSRALVLPTGTWTVRAVGGLAVYHSAGDAAWRIQIDGRDDNSGHALSVTSELSAVDDATVSGVAGGRTVPVRVQYRSAAGGTAFGRNPWVWVVATRE